MTSRRNSVVDKLVNYIESEGGIVSIIDKLSGQNEIEVLKTFVKLIKEKVPKEAIKEYTSKIENDKIYLNNNGERSINNYGEKVKYLINFLMNNVEHKVDKNNLNNLLIEAAKVHHDDFNKPLI